MVVVQAVELSVLAVAVVIKEGEPERLTRFFFPLPLKAPLERLVHHSTRLIFYFDVVREIAATGRSPNKPERIGVKFCSAVNKERFLMGINMPPIAHPSVKPEIF